MKHTRIKQSNPPITSKSLAHVNVNANSQQKNGVDDKEEDSMNEDGLAIGCEAAEFYVAAVAR